MIRWLAGILAILFLLLIAAVYIFIPAKLTISRTIVLSCNADGAGRYLSGGHRWDNWLAGTSFRFGGYTSHIAEVRIGAGDPGIRSWVSVAPAGSLDTTNLQWGFVLPAGPNPIARLKQYRVARSIADTMRLILEKIKVSLEKENVYGFAIREVTGQDSFLVVKRSYFSHYPSTGDVYPILDTLKKYSSGRGVVKSGYPMLNVTLTGKDQYQTMVALPVDRQMEDNERWGISVRKIVRGQFLMTEVKGGMGRVNEALEQLQNFVADHQMTVMAIPFQSLITDRTREPDTSRWITRLYYPVFSAGH